MSHCVHRIVSLLSINNYFSSSSFILFLLLFVDFVFFFPHFFMWHFDCVWLQFCNIILITASGLNWIKWTHTHLVRYRSALFRDWDCCVWRARDFYRYIWQVEPITTSRGEENSRSLAHSIRTWSAKNKRGWKRQYEREKIALMLMTLRVKEKVLAKRKKKMKMGST